MESDIVEKLLLSIRENNGRKKNEITLAKLVKNCIVSNILRILPEIQELDFFRSFYPSFYDRIFNFTSCGNCVYNCSYLFVTNNLSVNELINCLYDKVITNFEPPFVTYCPFCKHFVGGSEYLYCEAFKDDYFSYWIANLVKHYRHEHIRYYDLSWSNPWYGEKNPEYQKHSHDEYRIIVNNRAKRQLIRKLFKDENLTLFGKRRLTESVLNLRHNDDKTVETVKKYLEKIDKLEKKNKS